ncbi:hypothetical protein L6452_41105 [Arctium lappa]|uniref:Uncharacterized protein n=1 Tax=Arctium lappa TaxID=4217 RepID=A0ACB8XNT6_ARCLA|nr:hypothetical protein L6452_41105 [Arctium lappa]
MNHKQANIPFSWEMIPGVPKFMASPVADKEVIDQKDGLAPPPPPPPPPGCFREPVMRRSVSLSRKIFWREEDPFLVAFKECSKDYKVKSGDQMKKRFGIGNKVSFLWCSCSFDVEDGNLRTRPVAAACGGGSPVIPREGVQGLIGMHKGLRK